MTKKMLIGSAIAIASAGWAIHSIPSLEAIDTRTHPPASRTIQLYKSAGQRIFGHPLVPGGIHDFAQLAANMELYADLDIANTHFTVTQHATFAFVSYVKNGVMYWSKHPRFIPRGEAIITDGKMVILQKCGNVLRFDTPAPVETLFDEPDDLYPPDTVPGDITLMPMPQIPEVTDIPAVETPIPQAPISTPPEMGPISPVSPAVVGYPAFAVRTVDTPEPATVALCVLGLMWILPFWALFRR